MWHPQHPTSPTSSCTSSSGCSHDDTHTDTASSSLASGQPQQLAHQTKLATHLHRRSKQRCWNEVGRMLPDSPANRSEYLGRVAPRAGAVAAHRPFVSPVKAEQRLVTGVHNQPAAHNHWLAAAHRTAKLVQRQLKSAPTFDPSPTMQRAVDKAASAKLAAATVHRFRCSKRNVFCPMEGTNMTDRAQASWQHYLSRATAQQAEHAQHVLKQQPSQVR